MLSTFKVSVYTFVDAATGQPAHIASSALLAALERCNAVPVLAEISPSLVEALEAGTLGVEPAHALRLPDAALEAPIIVCAWGDTHVIADGAHRLWRRWKRGDLDVNAYFVSEPAWRRFVIEGMPGDGKYWDNFNRNAQVRG